MAPELSHLCHSSGAVRRGKRTLREGEMAMAVISSVFSVLRNFCVRVSRSCTTVLCPAGNTIVCTRACTHASVPRAFVRTCWVCVSSALALVDETAAKALTDKRHVPRKPRKDPVAAAAGRAGAPDFRTGRAPRGHDCRAGEQNLLSEIGEVVLDIALETKDVLWEKLRGHLLAPSTPRAFA